MNTETILLSESRLKSIAYDLIAMSVITLTPAISHMVGIPLYLLEPMRIMLLVSLFHTSQKNAYLLALVLPFFSLIISNHPSFIKAVVIATELILNVYLFFLLRKAIKNYFFPMFLSIIISKIYYYIIKYVFIFIGLMETELVSTPIYIQLSVGLVLSGYAYFIFRKESKQII